MTKYIDLNADIGEGAKNDEELLKIISSANIACGAHAGNEEIMRKTMRLAQKCNVICGAHPGFYDKENFGRKRLDLPKSEIEKQIIKQLNIIQKIAKNEGVKLRYVKLHGALANMAAENYDLSFFLFQSIRRFDESLAILALENSAQEEAGKDLAMRIIKEAYADRAYDENGLLVSRDIRGAILGDKEAIEQAVNIAKRGEIKTINGKIIKSQAASICLHGDNKGALELARKIKNALNKENIIIKSIS